MFGTSRFCTRSNVFTFGSYQKGKMSDDRCVAMCRSQTFDLGPLDKACALWVGSLSTHGGTADGPDVGWDDEAPPGKPRCCIRLNKSLSLNFTAIFCSLIRFRFSTFTSRVSFFASCFILSRCSRKVRSLAVNGSFAPLLLFLFRPTPFADCSVTATCESPSER